MQRKEIRQFCTHESQIIGKENSSEYEDAKDVTSPLVVDLFRLENCPPLALEELVIKS